MRHQTKPKSNWFVSGPIFGPYFVSYFFQASSCQFNLRQSSFLITWQKPYFESHQVVETHIKSDWFTSFRMKSQEVAWSRMKSHEVASSPLTHKAPPLSAAGRRCWDQQDVFRRAPIIASLLQMSSEGQRIADTVGIGRKYPFLS